MSDQENNNFQTESKTEETLIGKLANSSIIDSLYFSTGTIAALGIVFLISTFICGWYVFTLSDREIQIQKSEESLRNYDKIIESAKIKQTEENNLIMSIAEKKSDVAKLKIDADVYAKAKSTSQSEFDRLKEENAQYRTKLDVAQRELATARSQIPDLTTTIYDLEQNVEDLTAQIDIRKQELSTIEDRHGNFNNILLSTKVKLDKINGLENNFSGAYKEIQSIITQLEKMQSTIQSSSTDLGDQISELADNNIRISEETNTLKEVNKDALKATSKIQDISQKLNGSKTHIETLTTSITSADRALNLLVRQAETFQITINEESIEEINKSIETIANQFEGLKEDIEKEIEMLKSKE